MEPAPTLRWRLRGDNNINQNILYLMLITTLYTMYNNMFYGATKDTFDKAKVLRKGMTPQEKKLWEYLRLRPLGLKFRRQHPTGIYITDFYCHTLKLVIEVDGGIHLLKDIANRDKARQEYLEELGLRFLRFTNDEIDNQMQQVTRAIEQYITANI